MKQNYSLYPHPQVKTIKELLLTCAELQKDKPAFIYPKNRKEDVTVSYRQFLSDVNAFGTYLLNCGYHDRHIAVFGENSYEWILTFFSVSCGGNVIVPIDKDLSAKEVKSLLIRSDCSVLVYSDTYSDVVEEMQLDGIKLLNMKDLPEYMKQGYESIANGNRSFIDKEIKPDDLAAIVFTSGTTGVGKGVMLSHLNLAADTVSTCENVRIDNGTVLLLPLHHTFGLVAGVTCVLLWGHSIYINKSLKNINSDFLKAKPEHLSLVPMVIESLYNRIWSTAEKEGKAKALKVLITFSNALLYFGIDLRKKIFKSVRAGFGGELQTIVSGGANIEDKYIDGYKAFGITIVNGYGITECAPVVATNRNKCIIKGSVGYPCSCNKIKIADDGEILVKGDNVMQGYYNDPAANAECFEDGWFKTGDLGYIDNHDALHITGRKKNLIILSNGENISAEELEEKVQAIPYVKEVMVYGKDNVIVAEVFLDEETANGKETIHSDIQLINQKLPPAKNIGKVIIRETEFPKTTTKKIKRY